MGTRLPALTIGPIGRWTGLNTSENLAISTPRTTRLWHREGRRGAGRVKGILTMATDDKKEYRDVLLLLSHMGSGPAVINKLDQLAIKMEDPRLRDSLAKMAQFFRNQPELAHAKKFRLLDFAGNYSMNAGSRKEASNGIYAVQRYCEQHVSSQVPQWQLIAKAAGWTPPGAAS